MFCARPKITSSSHGPNKISVARFNAIKFQYQRTTTGEKLAFSLIAKYLSELRIFNIWLVIGPEPANDSFGFCFLFELLTFSGQSCVLLLETDTNSG